MMIFLTQESENKLLCHVNVPLCLDSKNTLHNISSERDTEFTVEKAHLWVHALELIGLMSHHPKIADLMEQWDGFFKAQLYNLLIDNI